MLYIGKRGDWVVITVTFIYIFSFMFLCFDLVLVSAVSSFISYVISFVLCICCDIRCISRKQLATVNVPFKELIEYCIEYSRTRKLIKTDKL